MFKRFTNYKNKYLEKKVLYLGTGTSVKSFPLEKLNKEIYTFAFNRFIPFYKEFWKNFFIDFYMCHDPTVMHTSFHNQIKMRKIETDEGFDIENDFVKKYKNTTTADFIIKNKMYKNTKIIFAGNLNTSHADRFNLLHNFQWMKKFESEMECTNFLPYKVEGKGFSLPEIKDNNAVFLKTWAKNSFCNSALPILFYLGFSEIYLLGVDYSNRGFFFSGSKNHGGFVEKETSDFNFLMNLTKEQLFHQPKIFTVKHPDTTIFAKDGCVNFESLI